MDRLAAYLALAETRPELFRNPQGAIFEILTDREKIQEAEREKAAELKDSGKPTEWAEVGIAFQDQYLLVLRDAVKFPDDSKGTYIRILDPRTGPTGTVVLPIWQEKVLLIQHFRHATRSWHTEIPRGFMKASDSRESALIELDLEVGGKVASLTDLGEIYPDTGITSSRVALFYAEVTSYDKPELKEAISDIMPTPIPQFERMIRDGELEDGFLLATYARAKSRGLI